MVEKGQEISEEVLLEKTLRQIKELDNSLDEAIESMDREELVKVYQKLNNTILQQIFIISNKTGE